MDESSQRERGYELYDEWMDGQMEKWANELKIAKNGYVY